MKFLFFFCMIFFILTNCGKKSEPEYQSKLDQVKIIL